MISLDEDGYGEEVTITFDKIPTLEHKAREGKESECSELKEDNKEKELEVVDKDDNKNENITSTI